jgi:unsaturated rhamnogalacturonyl hydrolase
MEVYVSGRNTFDVARQSFVRHRALHSLTHYTGILSLHAFARLACISDEPDLMDQIRAELLSFIREEYDKADFHANFTNYYCGGNATAFLYWQDALPEAERSVRAYAESLITQAPRDDQGIFSHPRFPGEGRIWIDVAFAVTPFLLFAGLAFEEDVYIEEAFQQVRKMVDVFRDQENGLLHQCKNFVAPGELSEDHWSRGNGWGLLALTELVNYLPVDDPRRPSTERLFVELVRACMAYQDEAGMWHQEITDHTSYVETSGTGLILYAIGVGLEKGILSDEDRTRFVTGLRGYLDYVAPDGSVYHTCRGCLCPGEGTILDYKARAPLLNDTHAFGPVTLAFGQAYNLGIEQIEREESE